MSSRSLGAVGEQVASAYLIQHGYAIVAKNIRVAGVEIDLVAQKGQDIHVVEVKTRNFSLFGGLEEAIDQRKLKRLIRAANMLATRYLQCVVQIDAILISNDFPLKHLQNIEIS